MSSPTSATAPRQAAALPRWRFSGAEAGALVALVVLVLANSLFTPNFASLGNLWNVLLQVSSVVLVASLAIVLAAEIGRRLAERAYGDEAVRSETAG